MVVVKDDKSSGDFLLVPICSVTDKSDATCQVEAPGGNLDLHKPSYAAYYMAKKVGRKATQMRVDAKEIRHMGEIDAALLSQIKAGIMRTKDAEPWFLRDFLRT